MGLKQGKVVKLETVVDPVGTITIDVQDADVLSIGSQGELILGIAAGDPTRPKLTHTVSESTGAKNGKASGRGASNTKVNYWKIESLTVQLWVKTTEPAERAN